MPADSGNAGPAGELVLDANGLLDGKTLAEHQLDIEQMMATNPQRYALATTQARYKRILELLLERGEINQFGDPIRKRSSPDPGDPG